MRHGVVYFVAYTALKIHAFAGYMGRRCALYVYAGAASAQAA